MIRKHCRPCNRDHYFQAIPEPFWQAVEQQPLIHRPMKRLDWSLAIVLGSYFAVLAFVLWRFGA